MLTIKFFFPLLFVFIASLTAQAQNQCASIFSKTYKVSEFIISVSGKKQSEKYLEAAHANLVNNFESAKLKQILKKLKSSGLADLALEEQKFIVKLRQNSSFLRSIFQTSDRRHESPNDFGQFVRDFGVLKDYILMQDNEGTQRLAKKILKNYSDLDFSALLKDSSPASKSSVEKYFKEILSDSQKIMKKTSVTIDEIHDVRKNLRDVLRFLQIQNEVHFFDLTDGQSFNIDPTSAPNDTEAIRFLKKINRQLGEVCDAYAGQILRAEADQYTVVQFPQIIRPRVEYFLESFKIHIH